MLTYNFYIYFILFHIFLKNFKKILKRLSVILSSYPYIFFNNSINIKYRHFRIYIDPLFGATCRGVIGAIWRMKSGTDAILTLEKD
jgi:hypothetical protein